MYEGYFGGVYNGKRVRRTADKVSVFWLLKRFGKVYTVIILNAWKTTLMPIMTRMTLPDSILCTDRFPVDALDVKLLTYPDQFKAVCR